MKKSELFENSQIRKKCNSTSNAQVKTWIYRKKRFPRKQSNKRFGDNTTSSEGKVKPCSNLNAVINWHCDKDINLCISYMKLKILVHFVRRLGGQQQHWTIDLYTGCKLFCNNCSSTNNENIFIIAYSISPVISKKNCLHCYSS